MAIVVSGDEVCAALERVGFSRKNQKGSRVKMKHADGRTKAWSLLEQAWTRESIALATNQKFMAIIERSRRSHKPGLSTEEMRRRLGLKRRA